MFCHYTSCVLLTFHQLPERALTPSVWFCALYEDSCPREALIGCVLVSDKFCDCLKGGTCDIDLTLKVDTKLFLSMLYVTCFKTSFAMELILNSFSNTCNGQSYFCCWILEKIQDLRPFLPALWFGG